MSLGPIIASKAARALPSASPADIAKAKKKPAPAPLSKVIPKVTVKTPAKTTPAPAYKSSPGIAKQISTAGTTALKVTTTPKQQVNLAKPIPGAPQDPAEEQKSGLLAGFSSSPVAMAAVGVLLFLWLQG